VYWRYIEGIIKVNEHFVPIMAWRMAISEGGIITGLLMCAEICSASCSGGMRGWRYIEWQYNEGTLYIDITGKFAVVAVGRCLPDFQITYKDLLKDFFVPDNVCVSSC
jgi:hypothetical protein